MKAWRVSDDKGETDEVYVVFAETRGKAKKYALSAGDGYFDWSEWTDLRAVRLPALDRYYKGRTAMEWGIMEDRVAMVREAGFHCSYEVDVSETECMACAAHEWCDRYERMKEDEAL